LNELAASCGGSGVMSESADVQASHPYLHDFSRRLWSGPNQDLDNPFGRGGLALHEWITNTRTFKRMVGQGQGATGMDDDFVARGLENVGAWILGRNMFGPIRGAWPDDHGRAGGATRRRITPTCSWRATSAAKGKDIRLGGGVSAIRQYLQAGLIDEIHVAISPVMLGQGEHLLHGIDTLALGYDCTQHVTSPHATHFVLTKRR
jgi:dihydrofolate reductase